MERNDILAVCLDSICGREDGKFSAKQTSDEIRAAMIELNGGSDKINLKTFHRGNALFELVEELIPVMIDEGIKESNNPLFKYVDYKNIKAGDVAEFYVEGEANFVVASAASGIRDVRRQRISGGRAVKVDTETKVVRVYENLGRLLAGRIDFSTFVNGVQKAFEQYILTAVVKELESITASTDGLSSTYVKSGSISVADVVTLCEHIEAATGKPARIIGTKTAIRKLGSSVTYSAEQNSDLYNLGYLGKVDGIEVLAIKQSHVAGTDTFAFADNALWFIAGDDKFIKVVNEGDGMLIEKSAEQNADLTQEYIYIQDMGVGIVLGSKIGYWYNIV